MTLFEIGSSKKEKKGKIKERKFYWNTVPKRKKSKKKGKKYNLHNYN